MPLVTFAGPHKSFSTPSKAGYAISFRLSWSNNRYESVVGGAKMISLYTPFLLAVGAAAHLQTQASSNTPTVYYRFENASALGADSSAGQAFAE